MPLSEKTLDEMRAGALEVAKNAGAGFVDPAYMEAMIRTQQRAQFLKSLEQEGKIRIERVLRPHTSDIEKRHGYNGQKTLVWVGQHSFEDPSGELTGAWPSEVLVANVALALAAGEGPQDRPFGR